VESFTPRKTVVVPNVDTYTGHISCAGGTKSEIICPLILRAREEVPVGVLDLDCLTPGAFNDETCSEKISQLVVDACEW
jgi:L-methionine (R)-S-oxide reductase